MLHYSLRNNQFTLGCNEQGALTEIRINQDSDQTNWVVNHEYLRAVNYQDTDKLFGNYQVDVEGCSYKSQDVVPRVTQSDDQIEFLFVHQPFEVSVTYRLNEGSQCLVQLVCKNTTSEPIQLRGLHLWLSLANVMYRDLDVEKNMSQSCAMFNHLSGQYSKFAAIKRSNVAPHLGVYQVSGQTQFMGTYCRFTNRFFEQVSPSLDGVIYHRASIVEDGASIPDLKAVDWLYEEHYSDGVTLESDGSISAEYLLCPIIDQEDFYQTAGTLGHPVWEYSPVITRQGLFSAKVQLGSSLSLAKAEVSFYLDSEIVDRVVAIDALEGNEYLLTFVPEREGEHKLMITLSDGSQDKVIFNVLPPISQILESRADWLVHNSYCPDEPTRPHAFLPLSNQGESLGKVAFVLIKNVLGTCNVEQIRCAEHAAAIDIRMHWFIDGEFTKPARLYDGFYRIFDLDFIGQIYFLLSQLNEVTLNSKRTYLCWAYEVLRLRLDPALHDTQREKEETEINGPFVYYVQDVISALSGVEMQEESELLSELWKNFGEKMVVNSDGMKGAITEHFFDNAGFGPTCKTLLLHGHVKEAKAYAELIKANIGFSNDYRMQSPDRWWEALAPMNHSLWGGLVASASLAAYEGLLDRRCLHHAYAASMAMFNCYDSNVKSSPNKLAKGEAASTFCCTAPNLNNVKLSRNRFGQDAFGDDPLFSNATGTDWDMGQELVTYCQGFGVSTYLILEGSKFECINGVLVEHEGKQMIRSYAAWPRRFVVEKQGTLHIVEFDDDKHELLLEQLLANIDSQVESIG